MSIRLKSFSFFQILFLFLAYAALYFIKNDLLLLSFFYYSLLLSFLTFYQFLNKLLLNNLLVYLLIFLFLYGIFNATIEYVLESEISKNTYYATLIYASIIPSFLLGFSIQNISIIRPKPLNSRAYKITFYNPLCSIILFSLIIFKSLYFYKLGILLNPSVLKSTNRLDLFDDFGQIQIVSSFLISSIFLYFIFNYSLIPRFYKISAALLLIYYISIQLSVGNRKEFVGIILGIFWVIVDRKKYNFSLMKFLLILVAIFLFLVLGSIRANLSIDSNSNDINSILISTLTSNEFVYPFETLKISIQNYFNGSLNLLYGLSVFLYPLIIFLPRIFFPFKFESLAVTFVKTNFGGGMGYAYSPVTESFINFGVFGPAIVFFIIGLILTKISQKKDQKFTFLLFTLVPDFCRGEFSTSFYQLFFQSLFLIVLPLIFKGILSKSSI